MQIYKNCHQREKKKVYVKVERLGVRGRWMFASSRKVSIT